MGVSWLVHPRLINDPFSDPGVYLDFRFERRALLFDLGDLSALSPRELMRVSDVFVSHTHMDHFAGFDRLLRVCLHRPAPLRLVGPQDFADQVERRLRSYTWNLLGPHSVDFRIIIDCFDAGQIHSTTEFRAREAFHRREEEVQGLEPGCVLADEQFRVEAVTLDHGIPSLAFALIEPVRVNVRADALERLGLPVGPWLKKAKRAVRSGAPDTLLVSVSGGTTVSVGLLKEHVLRIARGQKVAYVTDAADTPANAERIVALAGEADELFIEAAFLAADRAVAARTRHLTALRAGELGRAARVRHLTPFHFSARYLGQPDVITREVWSAFSGVATD